MLNLHRTAGVGIFSNQSVATYEAEISHELEIPVFSNPEYSYDNETDSEEFPT